MRIIWPDRCRAGKLGAVGVVVKCGGKLFERMSCGMVYLSRNLMGLDDASFNKKSEILTHGRLTVLIPHDSARRRVVGQGRRRLSKIAAIGAFEATDRNFLWWLQNLSCHLVKFPCKKLLPGALCALEMVPQVLVLLDLGVGV